MELIATVKIANRVVRVVALVGSENVAANRKSLMKWSGLLLN
jgi:hypothetical protein